jgi:2-polyprenyl-6-methoxyphenol hydroxylase-like FAD-dependent oxidoreductase
MNNEPASLVSQAENGKRFGKAIVMGASIAGLWTARALSDHFEEVIVFERDQLPEGPEFRSGAPQIRQFHTLLLSGLGLMRAWFPGLDEELIAAGAVPYDVIDDVHLRVAHFWYPRFPSGQILLSCSRPLLEFGLRRRLRQNPGIRLVEGVQVVGLLSDEGKRRVTGVRIRARRGGSDQPEADTVYQADLVVDALGRRSRTPEWLGEMGYPAPKESEVDSFLGYVTRKYKRKPNTPMILIIATPPHDPYGGLIFLEENDSMVALLIGYNKHYPPTDPDDFEAFAGHLGPEFQEAIKGAEPISKPHGYRGTSSRWRHYEQMDRWPERFVVLGDAFCGFNPVYGQGMSVAAMSAAALVDHISRSNGNLDGVARSTLREIGRITDGAWLLATSVDLSWPGTEGGTVANGPADRFGRWYVDQLLYATAFDKTVRLEFLAVNQLLKPAAALFSPGIFLRVMKQLLLRKRRAKGG